MRNYVNGSRAADKFVVRLPEGLRADVEQEASQADRSMNAVMVQAVKEYLNGRQRKKALIDTLEQVAKAQGDFNIGDHARMAMDARRYQVLRDELFRHGLHTTIPTGSALDEFTDEALRAFEAPNLQPGPAVATERTEEGTNLTTVPAKHQRDEGLQP